MMYRIIVAKSVTDLEEQVEKFTNNGWEPFEGVSMIGKQVVQSIIKRPPPPIVMEGDNVAAKDIKIEPGEFVPVNMCRGDEAQLLSSICDLFRRGVIRISVSGYKIDENLSTDDIDCDVYVNDVSVNAGIDYDKKQ